MTGERDAHADPPPGALPPGEAHAAEAPAPPPAGEERGPGGGESGESGAGGDAGTAGEGEAFVLRLPVFEGPLDLLLHLIERNELDITEVSLVAVTEQYLDHLRSREQINLGALADFIAIGARLLLLKSRALLAREEEPEEDEESGGALDLVEALREYRRFKQAAEFLRSREGGYATYAREAPPPETPLPTGLDTVTLDSLVDLLREILERVPEEDEDAAQPEVEREPIRLHDRMALLVDTLEREGRVSFRRMVESAPNRTAVIVDFLAVLELIKSRYLEARQSESFGDIDLVRRPDAALPDLAALGADFAEG